METRTSTEQTRRCFLGSAGAVALGAAAAGLSARATDAVAEESGSNDGAAWDKQADVLVIGAGFGGLTCTCAALDQGASVIMIDVSTRAGSTALMCSGLMTTHGSNSVEELSANAPLTDAKLGQAFLDAWPQLLGWLESIGAPLAEEQRETETGSYPIYRFGAELAPAGNIIFANFLESYAKDNGADIMYQTKAKKLLTDETGRVTGVKAIASDGSTLLIGAKNVILACGGTQNNKAMAAEYISPYADLMVSRGNPHDDGCGLAMAQEVGGVPSRGFGTFYGLRYLTAWRLPKTGLTGTPISSMTSGSAASTPSSPWRRIPASSMASPSTSRASASLTSPRMTCFSTRQLPARPLPAPTRFSTPTSAASTPA